MLAAAAFYSWSTVRLGSLAPRFAALELGATKSIVFALLAVGATLRTAPSLCIWARQVDSVLHLSRPHRLAHTRWGRRS